MFDTLEDIQGVVVRENGDFAVTTAKGIHTVPDASGNRQSHLVREWISQGGDPVPEKDAPDNRGYRAKRAEQYEKLSVEQTFRTTAGDFFDALVDFVADEFPNAHTHEKLGPLIRAVRQIKQDIPKD